MECRQRYDGVASNLIGADAERRSGVRLAQRAPLAMPANACRDSSRSRLARHGPFVRQSETRALWIVNGRVVGAHAAALGEPLGERVEDRLRRVDLDAIGRKTDGRQEPVAAERE